MHRASVDFPQPVSPTSPSVSPRLHIEAHVIDGADLLPLPNKPSSLNGKMLYQVFDAKQDFAHDAIPRSFTIEQPAADHVLRRQPQQRARDSLCCSDPSPADNEDGRDNRRAD